MLRKRILKISLVSMVELNIVPLLRIVRPEEAVEEAL